MQRILILVVITNKNINKAKLGNSAQVINILAYLIFTLHIRALIKKSIFLVIE